MTVREELLETVQLILRRLPDDATLRDFIKELEEMDAVEEGLRDVEAGRFMTLEEFKKRTLPCLTR